MTKFKLLFLFFVIITSQTFAQDATPTAKGFTAAHDRIYGEYYTISETLRVEDDFTDLDLLNPLQLFEKTKKTVLNLLRWTLHNKTRPYPDEKYARTEHFGRWINDPDDDTCMNTRAKVLVRDSLGRITYRNERNCVVAQGKWLDPYSNQEFYDAHDIQIDHMVPLKNAYMAGAWKWDYYTRCLYANYMGYDHHLIPASVRENTSKGDRSPDRYLPSEQSYRCQYVKDWLTIKLIWKLNMTTDEVQTIYDTVAAYNCDVSDFELNQAHLKEQRKHINSNLDLCAHHKR